MHLLELAKTAWNAVVSANIDDSAALEGVKRYLTAAREVLDVFGDEGDEGGPLDVIAGLEEDLKDDSLTSTITPG